jgi:isopenicillin-N epimerase
MDRPDRRSLLRAALGAAALGGCRTGGGRAESSAPPPLGPPAVLAADESYWRAVRHEFDLEPGLINLNHGLGPTPRAVHEPLLAALVEHNRAPLHRPRDGFAEGRREDARVAAARALGCDPEELAITRSATESLQIAQLGLDLAPGDEVLSTNEDYWAMWNTWQQRVRRDRVVYREIDLGAPHPDADEVVARFAAAITSRTRVLLFSHMTWGTGHILPAREICAMARARGVQTIVDGAHALGHIPLEVRALGCDYYGTAGHKWLSAPLGTGLLYVRRERIASLWPLTPAYHEDLHDDIRKFELVGSRSPAPHNAIVGAVEQLERIGVANKAARLRYLKRLWADRLSRHRRVHLVTDLADDRSCGIASFHLDGVEAGALADHLLRRHRILVGTPEASYGGPPIVRITPNVFTSAEEIDALAAAVEEVLGAGRLPT